jgi:ankyrin repeat protein
MSTATASASSKLHTTSLSQTSATSLPQITGQQKDEIINAIIASNLDLLKKIVSPDIVNLKDRSGNTLLHLATNNERTTVAKWLVSIGADVNAHCNGHTVLSSALNRANYELFDFYLSHKAECIGRNQLNLVHEAVQQQRPDIVDRLISLGADPNLYNSVHVTPLTIACAHRNLEICLILMENGACANLPDKKV